MSANTAATSRAAAPPSLYVVTPQAPIHSGFGSSTTAREVLAGRDLACTTAIVTGGSSGIG